MEEREPGERGCNNENHDDQDHDAAAQNGQRHENHDDEKTPYDPEPQCTRHHTPRKGNDRQKGAQDLEGC